jgi:hypothetical protein
MKITDKTNAFLTNIISLKDAILEQTKKEEFKKLAKILYECTELFEKKCRQYADSDAESEDESVDFSILESNKSDEGDKEDEKSENESYYSRTESEYNFDDTEQELKSNLVQTMKILHENLKKRECYENIEISKRKNLF